MLVAENTNFRTVVAALTTSTEQLENEQKSAAIQTIKEISDAIHFLSASSQQTENEFVHQQQEFSKRISEIIQKEGQLRQHALDTQHEIDKMNVSIHGKETERAELVDALNRLRPQLAQYKQELAEHQRRWDDLNDDSAGSIVLSIFSLGLDRAIKGISSLVHKDKQKISSLEPEVDRYEKSLHDSEANLEATRNMLANLKSTTAQLQKTVETLDQRRMALHNELVVCKRKAAFFTDVALFYGKLVIIAQQIDNRVTDVTDIIEELNDTTPRIIDFDGSGTDVISLRQALEKFDQFLSDNPQNKIAG